MPRINLLPKKKKDYNRKKTDKRKLRQKAYNSTKWRKLRLKYMKEHPMCEECHRNPAEDIHHLKSFIVNGEIDWELFLDEKNLMALCKECHGDIHSGKITQDKTYTIDGEEDKDEDGRYTIFSL